MNYWVNRISHEFPLSGVLFRYGYLTVGWSDAAVELLEAADSSQKLFKEQFYEIFHDLSNGDSLWRFLKEYEVGDIVVVPLPDKHNNKVSIVRIKSDVKMSDVADLADIGFVREIEHLKNNIPRTILKEIANCNLFACSKTTYSVNDYGDAIQSLIEPGSL